MAGDGTIKKSDIISEDVQPSIDSLKQSIKELSDGAMVLAETLKVLPGNFASNVKSLTDLNKATSDNQKLTEQTNEINRKLSEDKKKLTEEYQREAQATKEAAAQAKIKSQLDKEDEQSIKGLTAAVKLLTQERNNLNLKTEQGKARQKELNDEINKNNAIIKQNVDLQKQQTLNVGNYTESINNANLNLGEMRKELLLLKNTSFAGKTLEEIKEINKRMGELMHQMKESKAAVTNLGKNGFELMAGSAKFFAAGIETVVGSLSVLGVKSETLEKLKGNMMALIAITHGLSEMEEVLKSKTLQATAARLGETAVTIYNNVAKWSGVAATQASIAAKIEDTAVTEGSEAATVGLTTAQWLWNAALAACPIVIIILAVAALATGVYFLVKALNSGEDSTKSLTDKLEALKKSAAETESFNKFAESLMQAYGMAETAMVEAKIKHTKERIALISAEMAAEMALAKAKHEWTAEQSKEYTKQAQEVGNLNGEIILMGIELNNEKKKEADEKKKKDEDARKNELEENIKFLEAKHAKDIEENQQELNDHIKIIEAKRKLDLYESKTPGEIAKINADADREIYESKKKYSDDIIKLREKQQKEFEKEQDDDLKLLEQEQDLEEKIREKRQKAFEKEQDDDLKSLEQEQDLEQKIKEKHDAEELKRKQALANAEKQIIQKTTTDINLYFSNQTTRLKQEEDKQLANTHLTAQERENIKKQFAIKEAELSRKQAILDKALTATKIATDTSGAVMSIAKQWAAQPEIAAILIGATIALGAIEEALVISKPLPEVPSFKKGGKNVEGRATLHGGELVQLSTGEKFLTLGGVNEPIETILPKNTQIIPNEILREQVLNMPKTRNNDEILMQNHLLAELLKETKKEKKLVQFNMDADGIAAYQVSRNEYIKRIGKFRGNV